MNQVLITIQMSDLLFSLESNGMNFVDHYEDLNEEIELIEAEMLAEIESWKF